MFPRMKKMYDLPPNFGPKKPAWMGRYPGRAVENGRKGVHGRYSVGMLPMWDVDVGSKACGRVVITSTEVEVLIPLSELTVFCRERVGRWGRWAGTRIMFRADSICSLLLAVNNAA